MELFTADGVFVATVWPLASPIDNENTPNDVVTWGARMFRKMESEDGNEWWSETRPMVAVEMKPPEFIIKPNMNE